MPSRFLTFEKANKVQRTLQAEAKHDRYVGLPPSSISPEKKSSECRLPHTAKVGRKWCCALHTQRREKEQSTQSGACCLPPVKVFVENKSLVSRAFFQSSLLLLSLVLLNHLSFSPPLPKTSTFPTSHTISFSLTFLRQSPFLSATCKTTLVSVLIFSISYPPCFAVFPQIRFTILGMAFFVPLCVSPHSPPDPFHFVPCKALVFFILSF